MVQAWRRSSIWNLFPVAATSWAKLMTGNTARNALAFQLLRLILPRYLPL